MTLYDYVLMITITLMVNLARPFAMADDDDVCYETVKQGKYLHNIKNNTIYLNFHSFFFAIKQYSYFRDGKPS